MSILYCKLTVSKNVWAQKQLDQWNIMKKELRTDPSREEILILRWNSGVLKKKKKNQIKNWVKNGRTFKFKNYRMSIYKKLKH